MQTLLRCILQWQPGKHSLREAACPVSGGLFAFVALLLVVAGEPRASIAGVVIAGFSIGGIAYSLAVTPLRRRLKPRQPMLGGGALCAAAFAGIAPGPVWQIQLGLFIVPGVGFDALHNCVQVEASGLSASARGTACRCTRSASSWATPQGRCSTASASLGSARAPRCCSVAWWWCRSG